jgi:hypothetical protein
MSSAQFNVISWNPNDALSPDKLQTMSDNDVYLLNNMARAQYNGSGIKKDTGIRIASGLALITARKSRYATVAVNFNSYFSQSCKPQVTTGIVADSQRQIWATLQGPGANLLPTSDGFQITAYVDTLTKIKKITRNFYVSWHALGY